MKPRELRESGQHDLFRSQLDKLLNMGHEKVVLTDRIDWQFLSQKMGDVYAVGLGQPSLPTRLMAWLHILKYTDNLSDDEVCARWLEIPYYQYFCGKEFFCHQLPLDRSSLTRWCQRMGKDHLQALLQESLAVAVMTGAAKPSDFTQAVVDTTVAEKNVAFPTDAKLIHKARERLVKQARSAGINLRQSYKRVPKLLRQSLTWVRGTELTAHKKFSLATNMDVYFCDPSSPWQRGSNENTNGLLRQYFPKSSCLSSYSQGDLNDIADQLNLRPRKTLDFKTPAHKLEAVIL